MRCCDRSRSTGARWPRPARARPTPATIAVPPDVVDADLVLLVVATLGTGLAMRTGSRLSRPEGGLLVLGYAAYLTWLVLTRV